MYYTINNERTILVKLTKIKGLSDLNLNFFIELFLDKAPLEYLREYIFGIATHNHYNKIFSINFIPETPTQIINNFLYKYKNPSLMTSLDGTQFQVETNTPPKPLQMVTLYPMPFNTTAEQLQQITANWGKLVRFNFGRHKRLPTIRNPYLHLYLTNPNRTNIPDTIKVNNRFVTVTVQGEESVPRCTYCKSRDHLIDNCTFRPYSNPQTNIPQDETNSKQNISEPQTNTQTPQNKSVSYASVVQNKNQTTPYSNTEKSPEQKDLQNFQKNEEKMDECTTETSEQTEEEGSSFPDNKTSYEEHETFDKKPTNPTFNHHDDLGLSSSGSSSELSETELNTHHAISNKRQVEASSSDTKSKTKKKPKRPKLLSS